MKFCTLVKRQGRKIEHRVRAFREALADCTLHDLGYMGHAFKWSNRRRRKAGGEVRERLDRAAATASWCELFPLAVVKHLVASTSDHDPILLNRIE